MDPTGRFAKQQPIRIIEVHFATKSVLLTQQQCRRHFGRNSVPDRRTIQRLVAKFRETGSVADAPQKPQWPTSFKSFKSNKPESFSILWVISSQIVSRSAWFWSVCLCKIRILYGKNLRSSWRILKIDVLEIPVSLERRRVGFLGKSPWRPSKFWIFLGIMPNDERSRPLWASATLPVFRNLNTKGWIVFPSGTLFLPKSFLHCRCVRRTDFAAKYTSMIFICYCVV